MRNDGVSLPVRRTYDRATFDAARRAWVDGKYGRGWEPIRRIAAERGFLYPPSGTPDDDRDAEAPSQRAIIWRALQDNPDALRTIVSRSKSWNDVVDRIIGLEERLRRDADERLRDVEWDAEHERPTHREAVMALGSVLGRLRDSLP